MAILTELADAEIRAACAAFGVEVASAGGVLAGSVNTNYAVTAPDGARWFLRLYEEQDAAGARRETELVAALAAEGVPTPAPLERPDGSGRTVAVRGKPAALYPFVDGATRCQQGVAAADVASVGEALARVHLAGGRLDPARGLTTGSRFGAEDISRRLEGIAAAALPGGVSADEVSRARDRLARALEAIVAETVRAPTIPLIHGDLFRDNVLFTANGLALLDFESASTGTASFDLAVTSLAWCYGDALDPALVRALSEGYRRARPIAASERADLGRAARLACVRFATTRLTDYELRPRGMGVYKDFRRWMGRLEAVARSAGAFEDLFTG